MPFFDAISISNLILTYHSISVSSKYIFMRCKNPSNDSKYPSIGVNFALEEDFFLEEVFSFNFAISCFFTNSLKTMREHSTAMTKVRMNQNGNLKALYSL